MTTSDSRTSSSNTAIASGAFRSSTSDCLPRLMCRCISEIALDDRPRHLAHVVARGRLDLDDLGPEVDEVRRDGGRPEQRALDHADPVEHGRLSCHVRHSARTGVSTVIRRLTPVA